MYGMLQGQILASPSRRALAVWVLVQLMTWCIHGTSTGANVCEINFRIVVLLNH